jgi:hypothetical protein
MFAKLQSEYRWFDQLFGCWSVEQVCTVPDGTTSCTPQDDLSVTGSGQHTRSQ